MRKRLSFFVMGGAVCLAMNTAHAQTTVFNEDFGTCTFTGNAGSVGNHSNAGGTITVRLGTDIGPPVPIGGCTAWSFSGTAYWATVQSTSLTGPTAPAVGSHAIWLNEYSSAARTRGEMTRTVTGLTVGRSYTVSATAWTDDVPAATGLGLQFGPAAPVTLALPASSGPQTVSETVCAQASNLALHLYENGSTTASPVVSQVRLTDNGVPCSLSVSYEENGGSAVPDESGIAYEGTAAQPAPPTRAGFVFDGWYTDATLTTRYDFATLIKQDITLYAKWVTGPSYTLSGSIVGLTAGSTVGLANTGNGDTLPSASGTGFSFSVGLPNAAPYAVTVTTQPAGQTCSVTQNGSGTVPNANVTNVVVECVTLNYPLSGTVVGLALGETVTLVNGSETLPVTGTNFAFATPLPHGSSYSVSVGTQPNGQTCTVTQGSGTATAPVTTVLVTCTNTTPPQPAQTPAPVPVDSPLGLGLLGGLLAVLGWRRRLASQRT